MKFRMKLKNKIYNLKIKLRYRYYYIKGISYTH